jgi:nitrate reductase NapAB chaperone NapD
MTGVEVRQRDQRGKLIVLIDHPQRQVVSDTMMDMYKIDGVLNTSLIYEYFEEEGEAVDAEMPFATGCTI